MKDFNDNIDWELIHRSFRNSISQDEKAKLEKWLKIDSKHEKFYLKAQKCENNFENQELEPFVLAKKRIEFLNRIKKNSQPMAKKSYLRILTYCAVLMLFFMGLGILYQKHSYNKKVQLISESHSVLPGKGKVLLETSDGIIHDIDSLTKENHNLAYLTVHSDSKKLVYKTLSMDSVIYNKIIVPRGGEYQLILSDGTRVCLNSASELRYPITFCKKNRKVYLSGEAYFDVTHQDHQPFIVAIDDMEVEVYGTKFNINSHKTNTIETVLIEGSIGIRMRGQNIEQYLTPNELMIYDRVNHTLQIQKVDPYRYIAWKDGEFVFEDETIEQIMERLALWYDVDVFFANDKIRDLHYTGIIARFTGIHDLLSLIEGTSTVHFTIRNKVIIVN